MRATEKLRSDMDRAFRTAEVSPVRIGEIARREIDSEFGFVPEASRSLILESYLRRRAVDPTAALQWLGTLGGIFLQDYDDAPLARSDWEELRDILTAGSEEMDIDLLTYAMALVVERRAI
ncbi:MAG: hypothetical protein ABFC75_02800 [Rectinema sp.]